MIPYPTSNSNTIELIDSECVKKAVIIDNTIHNAILEIKIFDKGKSLKLGEFTYLLNNNQFKYDDKRGH